MFKNQTIEFTLTFFQNLEKAGRLPAEQSLTLLSRRDAELSLWYSDSTLNTFF